MGMDSLNDLFFSSTNQESMSYDQILEDVQRYCTSQHADKLSTEGNQEEARKLLREFIFQYISSRSYHVYRCNGQTKELLIGAKNSINSSSFFILQNNFRKRKE